MGEVANEHALNHPLSNSFIYWQNEMPHKDENTISNFQKQGRKPRESPVT